MSAILTKAENDEICNVCKSANAIISINGSENCGFCGNQVYMCNSCVAKMVLELGKNGLLP